MSVYSEFVSASALIVHCNAFSWFLDIDPASDQSSPDQSSPGFSLADPATAFSQSRSGAQHDAVSQGCLGH
jgi:hypothetical protein